MALPYIKEVLHKNLTSKIAAMVQTRIEVFPDIQGLIAFFETLPEYDTAMYAHKKMKTTKESALAVLKDVCRCLRRRRSTQMMRFIRCF